MAGQPIDRGKYWAVRWKHPGLPKNERAQQRVFDYIPTDKKIIYKEAKAFSAWVTAKGNRVKGTDPLIDARAYLHGDEAAAVDIAECRTFGVVLEAFLDAKRHEHKEVTRGAYRYAYGCHLSDWTMPVSEIDHETLNAKFTEIVEKGIRPMSARATMRKVKAVLSFAHERGYTTWSVREARGRLEFGKGRSTQHPVLTPKQFDALLAAAPDQQARDIVLFLVSTGVRISEMCAMIVGNIDYETGLIHVEAQMRKGVRDIGTKTDDDGEQRIALDDVSWRILPRYTEGRDWRAPLFPRSPNRHWTSGWWRLKVWKPMRDRLIEDGDLRFMRKDHLRLFGPHALRTTMATWMLDNKVPIEVVKDRMRHRSTTVTEEYYRVRTAESLRLEREGINGTLAHLNPPDDDEDGLAQVA